MALKCIAMALSCCCGEVLPYNFPKEPSYMIEYRANKKRSTLPQFVEQILKSVELTERRAKQQRLNKQEISDVIQKVKSCISQLADAAPDEDKHYFEYPPRSSEPSTFVDLANRVNSNRPAIYNPEASQTVTTAAAEATTAIAPQNATPRGEPAPPIVDISTAIQGVVGNSFSGLQANMRPGRLYPDSNQSPPAATPRRPTNQRGPWTINGRRVRSIPLDETSEETSLINSLGPSIAEIVREGRRLRRTSEGQPNRDTEQERNRYDNAVRFFTSRASDIPGAEQFVDDFARVDQSSGIGLTSHSEGPNIWNSSTQHTSNTRSDPNPNNPHPGIPESPDLD
ncbi:hypothetical protein CANTEDRAFT_91525 [Yamadazyma tenuis ATCC 10573]|nr:uncharacterized protein CANTEDRAFT_91525 [Yamadazyma tenuis ATCC 10573]EGV66364.1 hypothetical protein CANTEDRAFT_91525 [Yamadazyma tenuis ATCC 10573]